MTLEGIEPPVLRSLVHFLYAEELDESAMEHPRQLLAAADQYEVPRLVALCEERLCEGIDDDSAAAKHLGASIGIAVTSGCADLTSLCPLLAMGEGSGQAHPCRRSCGAAPALLRRSSGAAPALPRRCSGAAPAQDPRSPSRDF